MAIRGARNLKARGKPFGEVEFGDELYYINPTTFKIGTVNVKEQLFIEAYPTHVEIHYYKPSKDILINDEAITEGSDYLSLIVPRNEFFILTMNDVPTVFSTSKDVLEEWMQKKK